MIRHLIIAAEADPSGPWLRDGLWRRGFCDVCLMSVDALAYSTSLTHRLTPAGEVSVEVMTSAGVIGPNLEVTINRTEFVPVRHLDLLKESDREYATSEIYALFTSILAGLRGKVINRAGSRGLSGPILSEPEWLAAGAVAGLQVHPLRWPSSHEDDLWQRRRLFVLPAAVLPAVVMGGGDRVPGAVATACQRLAELQKVELMALDFRVHDGAWLFAGANCTPDVREGGEPLLDALAKVLL